MPLRPWASAGLCMVTIGDRAFFNNILGLWLGDVPADEELKKTILGQ